MIKNLDKNWTSLETCISSLPLTSPTKEIWFTSAHKHDSGAWRTSKWYLNLPLIGFFVKKAKKFNRLVNKGRRIATERGVSAIFIDLGECVKGSTPIRLQIILEQWVMTHFWKNFLNFTLFLGVLVQFGTFMTNSGSLEGDHTEVETGFWVVAIFVYSALLCFLEISDFTKDNINLIFKQHVNNWFIFGLTWTIVVPTLLNFLFFYS